MHSAFHSNYEQHASETAFLWQLWNNATAQPQYNAGTLAAMEARIFQHIAGMMVQPDVSFAICKEGVSLGDASETFAAAQVAFRSYKVDWVQVVVEHACEESVCLPGLISAMDWLPNDICHPWIKRFFESKVLDHKVIALRVCLTRGEDPGHYLPKLLEREDCQAFEPFQLAALETIGNFKRRDLLPYVNRVWEEEKTYLALRAKVLMDDLEDITALQEHVMQPGEYQWDAMQWAFRKLPVASARQWIAQLAKSGASKRTVLEATRVLGDPHAIQWLLNLLDDVSQRRMAAAAICHITGLQIVDTDLEAETPYLLDEAIEQDTVLLPEEEFYPWPEVDKLKHLCQTSFSRKFKSGLRYLAGELISEAHLKRVLKDGVQPQRIAAAQELGCLAQYRLTNVRARQSQKS